ncbi:MAG: D-alanyl-D-alanine dipeptidase [Paraglaciecola sp.]|jgi:D-alanyl-D-alanine dipeptidase|uniref:M15 family metallopeptidase n=1 Tax=Polaribacter sp. TaxID=1920175 RepID=UPI003EEACBB7
MKKLVFLSTFLLCSYCFSQELPDGFVYLSDVDKTIKSELRYLSSNNFIGKPIDGYSNNRVIITKPAAINLKKIQTELLKKGFSLKIFDAYRPQQAVNHFVKWAKVLNDTLMKKEYYPEVHKSELFNLGYIASKSGHTRGSTLDVTIINIKTAKELDMGSPYDFFGVQSHPFYPKISKEQKENRVFLRAIMLQNNFKPYENEWWHFTLIEEPFPNTYFNFPVK